MPEADNALYRVWLLNDDETPMDFVVYVLETFFHMRPDLARERMLLCHEVGTLECGTYPHAEAVRLENDVEEFARSNGFPLQVAVEDAGTGDERIL